MTPEDQVIGVRLPAKLVRMLDVRAKELGTTRARLIREILAGTVGYETEVQRLSKALEP